jgi:hypothetical protein
MRVRLRKAASAIGAPAAFLEKNKHRIKLRSRH